MTLQETLADIREKSAGRLKPEIREPMHRHTEELRATGILEGVRKTGERAPAFDLPDTKGERVSSLDLLKQGPLVVSFFRGQW